MTHRARWILSRLAVLVPLCAGGAALHAEEKVTYQDHALPLFRNSCLGCHNPDKKKAGLDLSTYAGALAGGDNGPVINAGDPNGSKLYKVITHAEEPEMPPKKDKLPDKELDVIRKWIAGGALETASGKPAVAAKPKADLSLSSVTIGKPTGPVPMPSGLSLDPIVHTQRPGALLALATDPWAPLVAVGGQKQVLLYHTQSLELLGVLPFLEGLPQVLKFSRSGALLLAGGGTAAKNGKVVLLDVATGNRVAEVGDEFDTVLAADLTADQSIVALGGPGKVVKGYSVADGKLLYAIKKHTDWVTALAFSPDGAMLATGDRAGNLAVWEAKTGGELFALKGHKEAVTDLCFRDDSTLLLTGSQDGSAKLWEMNGGTEVKSWAAHGSNPGGNAPSLPTTGTTSVAFAHDGRIVTAGRDKAVKLWGPEGNAGKTLSPPFPDIALRAAFDHEGGRVIAGDWTGQIKVWAVADASPVGELALNPQGIEERLGSAAKRLANAEADAKTANERLEGVKRAADAAAAALARAKHEVAQLKVSQAASAMALARAALTEQESKLAPMREALKSSQAAADKAAAEADAFEKTMSDLPARLKAKQEAVDRAKGAALTARADAELAADALKEKEPLRQKAIELAQNLAEQLTKSADNAALADSADRAKSAADALSGAVTAARQAAAQSSEMAKKADDDHAAAEAALAKEQAYADAAPKAREALKKVAADARATAAQKQAALDEAAKPVEQARQRFAQAKADHERLLDEAADAAAATRPATDAGHPSTLPAGVGDH